MDSDKESIKLVLSTDSKKSKKSTISSRKKIDELSEDISISQLEMMANKKKLIKKNELSMSELNSIKKEVSEHKLQSSSELSSISSKSMSEEKKKKKARIVNKENNNDDIRREKSEFLYKLNKMNVKGKWSSLNLDMNNSLDEIKNECARVRNEIQTEKTVGFYKRMLLLGVQGIEMVNNKFDPLGIDLDGWSEAMGYNLENQEYDETITELYEKYKGTGSMSPELKLIFMIISSAAMFTVSKKISTMDAGSAFANVLGNFVGGVPQQNSIPNPNELKNMRMEATETTEDQGPSKMQGPIGDDIDINNILKQMQKSNEKNTNANDEQNTSDDVFKSIPMNTKRRRGRPKKTNVNKMV